MFQITLGLFSCFTIPGDFLRLVDTIYYTAFPYNIVIFYNIVFNYMQNLI